MLVIFLICMVVCSSKVEAFQAKCLHKVDFSQANLNLLIRKHLEVSPWKLYWQKAEMTEDPFVLNLNITFQN